MGNRYSDITSAAEYFHLNERQRASVYASYLNEPIFGREQLVVECLVGEVNGQVFGFALRSILPRALVSLDMCLNRLSEWPFCEEFTHALILSIRGERLLSYERLVVELDNFGGPLGILAFARYALNVHRWRDKAIGLLSQVDTSQEIFGRTSLQSEFTIQSSVEFRKEADSLLYKLRR